MPSNRMLFFLLAFFVVFIGGNTYYSEYPIRVAYHIIITVGLAGWLGLRLRRGRGLPETPLDMGIAALVALWGLSAVFSLDPRMSFEHLWTMLTHVLFFYVLADMVQRGRQRLVMETQFLFAALILVLAALQIVSWYFGLGIVDDTEIGWVNVIGPGVWLPLEPVRLWLGMGVSTWLAAYTAPLVVLTAAWGYTTEKRSYRTALAIMSGLLLGVTLLTLSRGGIVALLAAGSAFVLLRFVSSPTARVFVRRFRWIVLASLGIGGVIALAALLVISRDPSRIAGDALRLDLWTGAVEIIADEPVLGVGPGMFARAFRNVRDASIADPRLGTAHNIYLNTTAEIGLIGVLVGGLLIGLALRGSLQRWRATIGGKSRLRLEAAFAALVGFCAQSFFDNFTMTAVVTVFLVLLAYSVTVPGTSALNSVRTLPRWTSGAALLGVLVFGGWLLVLNHAQGLFQSSISPDDATDRIALARAAEATDPTLNLYDLQIAYLQEDYVSGLQLEPTWETGLLNQAAQYERAGDITAALDTLQQVNALIESSPASLHWSRLCEQTACADDEAIINGYLNAMWNNPANPHVPTAAFWTSTPLRRAAIEQLMARESETTRYRLAAVHFPEQRGEIVPADPQTAGDWGIVGLEHLDITGDADAALAAFNQAVELSPRWGDAYAARARARLEAAGGSSALDDTTRRAIIRDLDLATLLDTSWEYPNATRALVAQSQNDRWLWLSRAMPPRSIDQSFEALLFNRTARFDIDPAMRFPGPGREAMQPWYTLAAELTAAGEPERAQRVYEAIVDYAPDEADNVAEARSR